jgi:hypothetical protein
VSVWRKAAHLNSSAVTYSTANAFWPAWIGKQNALCAEALSLILLVLTVSDVLHVISKLFLNVIGCRLAAMINSFVMYAKMSKLHRCRNE